jgi:hypothetical protein
MGSLTQAAQFFLEQSALYALGFPKPSLPDPSTLAPEQNRAPSMLDTSSLEAQVNPDLHNIRGIRYLQYRKPTPKPRCPHCLTPQALIHSTLHL